MNKDPEPTISLVALMPPIPQEYPPSLSNFHEWEPVLYIAGRPPRVYAIFPALFMRPNHGNPYPVGAGMEELDPACHMKAPIASESLLLPEICPASLIPKASLVMLV